MDDRQSRQRGDAVGNDGGIPPAPAHTTSPPKSGRRVSFNGDRLPSAARAAAGTDGGSIMSRQGRRDSAVSSIADDDSHGPAQTLTGEDADARKNRRARYRRRSSSDGAGVQPGEAGTVYEEEEEDDRSVRSRSTVRSILQRVVMFAGLTGDDYSDSSGAHKAHPKHCMCGCRAY